MYIYILRSSLASTAATSSNASAAFPTNGSIRTAAHRWR